MKHLMLLAGTCANGSHNYGQCAKEAASSWSHGGLILGGIILLVIVAWIKKK